MSPYHSCRLFAIYLTVILIISESPASAYTVRWAKTTLKPFSDLTAEPSVLLETRYDLPKTNNIKGNTEKDVSNTSFVTRLPPRSFSNVLEGDNKSTLNNNNVVTSSLELLNENETTKYPKEIIDLGSSVEIESTAKNDLSSVTDELKFGDKTLITTSTQDSAGSLKTDGFLRNLHSDNDSTLLQASTIDLGTESVTFLKDQFETMTGEASSSPSWKTYTTIERKRTTIMPNNPITTEQMEMLSKSETVTSQVTLDPLPAKDNLESSSLSYTRPVESNSASSAEEQAPVTLSSESDPTTTNTLGYLSSKRAGFLDLTVTQTFPEKTTIGYFDGVTFDETELLGAMFDVDEPVESNKSSSVESRSQMAEDEIKEKLLEEQVQNDNLRKSFEEDKTTTEKPTQIKEPVTEDSLSVKPISSKGSLYTVSPHYKPMKKIEVQPSKPFIRDPDDNSWRNESLSLLGIVFKAKNASKPFTEVLRNKTEAVLSNMNEKDEKNEVSDLRERLEKITEVRKSRKKINKFGDTVYSDYEEGTSNELVTSKKPGTIPVPLYDENGKLAFIEPIPTTTSTSVAPKETTTPGVYMYKEKTVTTTKKPKKKNKFFEYYDTTDEYDTDYVSLPKIDLMKFSTRTTHKEPPTTTPTPITFYTKSPKINYLPERKPTIQYFPPRPQTQKVNINDYDNNFQRKISLFTFKEPAKEVNRLALGTEQTTPFRIRPIQQQSERDTVAPLDYTRRHKPTNLDHTHYVTYPSQVVEPGNRYPTHNDETFNRASYVIKHYKDLINEAVQDDYDKNGDFVASYTELPLPGVTHEDPSKTKLKPSMDDEYDYVANFRKDLLNRFVDNFNQNSETFKVDFPILYNNSIVHMTANDNGKVVASSSAFLRRLYETPVSMQPPVPHYTKPCDPHCDIKVDLSPDYELHYYVPEQEEKEVLQPKAATIPFTYRL